MKSIFDQSTRDELMRRIDMLDDNCTAQWGKMNIYQMMKHCMRWDEMIIENKKYNRVWVGFLFGKMALKQLLKDDRPMTRNAPTISVLKIKEGGGDIEVEKQKWLSLIKRYAAYSNPYFIHPFFGKMSKEQLGYFVYKHTDHHLRQFNS